MARRGRLTWTIMTATLLLLTAIDLYTGSIRIDIIGIIQAIGHCGNAEAIIWDLRIPRIMTAILAGSGMAICGAQMQALFRNPLADPHILGISAGAGAGVATFLLAASFLQGTAIGKFLSSAIGMTAGAAAGALIISSAIILISTRLHRASALLAAGVMLGFIMSAVSSIIEFQIDETRLKMYWNWAAGSFTGNSWSGILIMTTALVAGSLTAMSMNKGLSIMLFGDELATSTGVKIKLIRILSMLSCCLITGTVTAFCGPIGFVGIISPHIARQIFRQASMRTVLPASMMTGACISLSGDILSQIWNTPLPVGSTIALIGIPVIFVILRRYQE